ncbi:hypothetical protein K505DRAFT_376391 [Melanomma pulvis-pyrius CBS 109.77]|uniref:P-loop containing nucleoside triphosphate hydrolase protein n=1 Tax=Melanomma pulvis-pyrius CBS 109.77 TaxID=1314802 RepID=A0A6A6X6K8_9PLEO|nr:hypothetical protein K505DRAFT_376391 [Melanomma pulvis-pyrius CBS 109.77]
MSTQQTPPKLFIQMSGAPGSGKSTIARSIADSIGGVVIDHDVLRSSLLDSGIAFHEAARHAYQLQWMLARNLMRQGHSVIIDSTCNFPEILSQGSTCAQEHGHAYWYVECKAQDIDLLDERLRNRSSMTSQRTGVNRPPPAAAATRGAHDGEDGQALFKKWIENPCRPVNNVVIVDSTLELETIRDSILKQIRYPLAEETLDQDHHVSQLEYRTKAPDHKVLYSLHLHKGDGCKAVLQHLRNPPVRDWNADSDLIRSSIEPLGKDSDVTVVLHSNVEMTGGTAPKGLDDAFWRPGSI